MRRLLLGAAFAAIVAAPASAADLVVKAPPVIFSWTGCYVGTVAGGSFGRGTLTDTVTGLSVTGSEGIRGLQFGGTVGCNYQWDRNFVIGFEGDASWSHEHAEAFFNSPFFISALGFAPTGVLCDATHACGIADVRERWASTARIRAGYATDKAFFYITGGGAWDSVRTMVWNQFAPPFTTASQTTGLSGWVAGVGMEWWMLSYLTAKVEFLYASYGSKTLTGLVATGGTAAAPTFTPFTDRFRFNDAIIRIGVNYHFGTPAPVVRASY